MIISWPVGAKWQNGMVVVWWPMPRIYPTSPPVCHIHATSIILRASPPAPPG